MAYPLLGLAIAATAAGAAMQAAGAAQARGAMNEAQAAELTRQKRHQTDASEQFQQSLAKSGRKTADEQLQAGEDRRLNAYQAVQQSPVATPIPTAAGRNSVVTDTGTAGAAARAKAAATATANAWSRLVGGAQARLGGEADWQLEQAVKNAEANRNLGIIARNARGSADVLPLEMEQASHAGDGLAGWGQLVGALGSIAAMKAATKPTTAGRLANPGVPFDPVPVAGYQLANSWADVPGSWLRR